MGELTDLLNQSESGLVGQLRIQAETLAPEDSSLVYHPFGLGNNQEPSKITKGITVEGKVFQNYHGVFMSLFSNEAKDIKAIMNAAEAQGWKESTNRRIKELLGTLGKRAYTKDNLLLGIGTNEKGYLAATLVYGRKKAFTNKVYIGVIEGLRARFLPLTGEEQSPAQQPEPAREESRPIIQQDTMLGRHPTHVLASDVRDGIMVRMLIKELGGMGAAYAKAFQAENYSTSPQSDGSLMVSTTSGPDQNKGKYIRIMDIVGQATKIVEGLENPKTP